MHKYELINSITGKEVKWKDSLYAKMFSNAVERIVERLAKEKAPVAAGANEKNM